jgi:hypothetical protein
MFSNKCSAPSCLAGGWRQFWGLALQDVGPPGRDRLRDSLVPHLSHGAPHYPGFLSSGGLTNVPRP